MATLSSLSTTPHLLRLSSHSLHRRSLHFQSYGFPFSFKHLTLKTTSKSENFFSHITKLKSVEEEAQIPDEQPQPQPQEQGQVQEGAEQQTVSVPVSPADKLTMFFQVHEFF